MFPPMYYQREYFETDYFWPDWAVYIVVAVGWHPADPYAVIEVEQRIQTAMRVDRPIVGMDFLSSRGEFVPVEYIVVIEGNESAGVSYDTTAPVTIEAVNPYADTFTDEPDADIED